jgi:hypothetical protein
MCGNIKSIGRKCLLLLLCSSAVLAGARAVVGTPYGERGAITTGSLFDEMVDMANLASFPKPAFRTVQFSSYDHRSRLPGGPDWFANSDGFGGEPIPNFEKVLRAPDANGIGDYLIAEVHGPGAIVRLWTAAISGSVLVNIDGSQAPVFEGSADDFFRRPYDRFAQVSDIDIDGFRQTIYQRDASYAPIPFAESLRVVWIGNVKDIHFYQLQVRLYDEGTRVASFRPEDIHTYRDTIDRVTLILSDPDKNLVPRSQRRPEPFEVNLESSDKKTLARLDGPLAIEQFSLQLSAEDMDRALRQT